MLIFSHRPFFAFVPNFFSSCSAFLLCSLSLPSERACYTSPLRAVASSLRHKRRAVLSSAIYVNGVQAGSLLRHCLSYNAPALANVSAAPFLPKIKTACFWYRYRLLLVSL